MRLPCMPQEPERPAPEQNYWHHDYSWSARRWHRLREPSTIATQDASSSHGFLAEEEREVSRCLEEQISQEKSRGGARSMWSILRQLARLTQIDIEFLIEVYEKAQAADKSQKPERPAPDQNY